MTKRKRFELGNEKSLLYFVQNEASSGSIANKTRYSSYKDIDAIRNKAVQILMRDGDREYSLLAFNYLIQEAVILIEEDELTGESAGERRAGMEISNGGYMANGGSPKYYIEFLNKNKGFKRDKKEFASYEDAIAWGRKNLGNFNSDMIRGQYVNGGYMAKGGDVMRKASLEEQAIEAIGNNVWYSIDAAKQEEVITELLRDGVISARIYEDGGGVWSDLVTDFEEDGSCYVLGSNETGTNKILAKITPRNKIIYFNEEAKDIPEVQELLLSMSNEGFANGGTVVEAEKKYLVKYKQKGSTKLTEKTFTDKDDAELFWDILSEEEGVVLMPLEEVLPEKPKKESLFAKAKPVTKTAASKSKREKVEIEGIADKIYRYDELKADIKNATAEKEVIGRILKDKGVEKFLELYEEKGSRPDNFDLADGEQSILLEVTDAYLKVEKEKEEILKQYDGLLEETIVFKFDSKLLDKETESGQTIGEIISNLIESTDLISEDDKDRLIQAERTVRVKKGSIDRLLDYDNPREIFELISPILALK